MAISNESTTGPYARRNAQIAQGSARPRCAHPSGHKLLLTFEDLYTAVVTTPDCEASKAQSRHFEWMVQNLTDRHGQIVQRKLLARVV